jgi:hypothetical protein
MRPPLAPVCRDPFSHLAPENSALPCGCVVEARACGCWREVHRIQCDGKAVAQLEEIR